MITRGRESEFSSPTPPPARLNRIEVPAEFAGDPSAYWPLEDGELDDSYGTCAECGGKLSVRPAVIDFGPDPVCADIPAEIFCTECRHVR